MLYRTTFQIYLKLYKICTKQMQIKSFDLQLWDALTKFVGNPLNVFNISSFGVGLLSQQAIHLTNNCFTNYSHHSCTREGMQMQLHLSLNEQKHRKDIIGTNDSSCCWKLPFFFIYAPWFCVFITSFNGKSFRNVQK